MYMILSKNREIAVQVINNHGPFCFSVVVFDVKSCLRYGIKLMASSKVCSEPEDVPELSAKL